MTTHRAPSRAPGRAGRAAVPLAAAALAAVLVVVWLSGSGGAPTGSVVGRWAAGVSAASAAPTGTAGSAAPSADPFGTAATTVTGTPGRLRVPAIGVDSALERLRIDAAGALTPPKDFAKAGWYVDGTPPGDVGPAVVAGHVDSRDGPAVFFRLRELQAGDTIEVIRGGRTVRFTVTGTAWYPKSAFPTAKVYGPTPDRQLRLITCGGVFDRSSRSYKDNLVVSAVRN